MILRPCALKCWWQLGKKHPSGATYILELLTRCNLTSKLCGYHHKPFFWLIFFSLLTYFVLQIYILIYSFMVFNLCNILLCNNALFFIPILDDCIELYWSNSIWNLRTNSRWWFWSIPTLSSIFLWTFNTKQLYNPNAILILRPQLSIVIFERCIHQISSKFLYMCLVVLHHIFENQSGLQLLNLSSNVAIVHFIPKIEGLFKI